MNFLDMELEGYVPLSIKTLDCVDIEVAAVALVTEKRTDGSVKLVIPQCTILVDPKGKAVRAWTVTEEAHVSKLETTPYEIDLPLMPKQEEADAEDG